MSKHIGFPGERINLTLVVQKVNIRETEFGPIADHSMHTPDGDILFWSASKKATWLEPGGTYSVKATIKTHDADDQGVKRTHLLRVVEHYEPPRMPRVSIGLSRGAVRHR